MFPSIRSVVATSLVCGSLLCGNEARGQVDEPLPRFKPKPVIWVEDYKPKDESKTKNEQNSQLLVRYADRLKSAGEYGQAEEAYIAATKYDPSNGYAHYQLACNYELWGKHEQAVEQYETALKVGYSDFPTVLADGELGGIRERPEFADELKAMRKTYIESANEMTGHPIAIRPDGEKPKSGWPLIFLLHGYGDSNTSYIDNAQKWAEAGFLAVALPGSVPAGEGRYMWSSESTDATLKDLEDALASPLLKEADRSNVHLLGFSQGALHSMLLATKHSDRFASVVAVSPGGSLARDLYNLKLSPDARTGKCYFIHGDQEPHAPLVEIWKQAYERAGWKFMSATHPGSHHFPADWDQRRKEVIEFMRSKSLR